MTKTEKLLILILVWLVIFASAIALCSCNSKQPEPSTVWIVVADNVCWETFNQPRTSHNETWWTTREGGEMLIVGDVYYLEVVDGNMSKAYLQLGVSEEQCLNL